MTTAQRVGLGIDVHPFVSTDVPTPLDRELVLGGVRFPGERPLHGHSDADVVAHAIGDAILGAAALGDLGTHFPDSDERYRGVDSLVLLSECARRAADAGWHVVNVDCTVVTEHPRLAVVREEMMENLSRAAGGPVHVKATRPEGLGSLGRIEGIACLAVVLLDH